MTNIIKFPIIAGIEISTDQDGRFNLNALHKASGLGDHKRPSKWLAIEPTRELIHTLESQSPSTGLGQKAINSTKGGNNSGTFAHELLAVSYASWISPIFQLQVNQAFLDFKSGKLQPTQKPLSTLEILELALVTEKKNLLLESKLEEAQPKIQFAEAVNDSINCVSIQNFAKAIGTGQNRLFALLREEGYLMQGFGDKNKPYQRFVDQGLFKLAEKVRKDHNGENQTYFKTLITPKGQQRIQSKYFNQAA